MKKAFVFILFVFVMIVGYFTNAYAQDATSSASSRSSVTPDEINSQKLIEKVANKVAEERKKNQRAVSGVIKTIKDNFITISGYEGLEVKTFQINIDTSFNQIFGVSTGVKKEIKISDLKPNNYIIVTGPLLDKAILANSVYLDDRYVVKSGTITEVNKTNYSIVALTPDKSEYTIDIEATTKQYLMNIKTLEIEKTGFSKIKEGDVIHFVGILPDGKEPTGKVNITGKKYVVIPQEYFIK